MIDEVLVGALIWPRYEVYMQSDGTLAHLMDNDLLQGFPTSNPSVTILSTNEKKPSNMERPMLRFLLPFLLLLLSLPVVAQEKSGTILVLDASGSMWGRIDGKEKITIAQDVISDLLRSLPPEHQLGLTVYGHRRKGDCSDIETMILPGGDTRAAIEAAVRKISPKGKTPLSAAVIQAAEALKYSEESATVILISDGRETCHRNTCEVGRQLEKSGVNFTAHVIGFDVTNPKDRAELQCLADETGGQFLTASNARELSTALQVVSEPEPTPTPVTVTFQAIDGKNGPKSSGTLVWWLKTEKDGVLIENQERGNGFSAELMAGKGEVEVMRDEDEAMGKALFSVAEGDMQVTVVLPEMLPEATLDAPETAVAGSNVAIEWSGPDDRNDSITVSRIGSGGGQYVASVYTRKGNPTVLKMPIKAGEYQLRYVRGGSREILARQVIVITQVSATLKIQGVATAGGTLPVEWSGPDYQGDYISIAKPGSRVNQYQTYTYTKAGNPTELRVPTTPGEYILRYIAAGPDQAAIAKIDMTVEPVSATLEYSRSVPAGGEMQVTWDGPSGKQDYIAIAKVGSKANDELTYSYTRHSEGDSLTIKVPTKPGTYELRYILNGKPRVILLAESLVVEPVAATLEYSRSVPAGGEMQVTWDGPGNKQDYIAIAKVGSKANDELTYSYTRHSEGDSLTIKVPTKPGTYELRYILNGSPRAILISEILNVESVSARLDAASETAPGSNLVVSWEGPDYAGDYIAISRPGKKGHDAYTKTSEGSPLIVKAPLRAGEYELRYVMRNNQTVLFRKPLSIK